MRASKRFQSIKDNKSYCYSVFKEFTFLFDPLTTNDELSRHENLTFLWTWTQRWVPRSFATHASLCNNLSSNKLSKNSKNPDS